MARLQLKWGRKVDFEDVIMNLVLQGRRRPELLEEASDILPTLKGWGFYTSVVRSVGGVSPPG
ncbi:MAG: hypothetical protein WED07_01225 [Candidatus Freyarchaeum deiterrae]